MKINKKLCTVLIVFTLIMLFINIFPCSAFAVTNTSFPRYGTIIGTSNYGGLNVRKGPSTTYSSLGKLTDGTLVKLESESNGWYKINYNNQTAYISSSNGKYVTINNNYTSKNKILYTGIISVSDALNVRKGPGSSYTKLGKLNNGTIVYLLSEKDNGWYKITYNNQVAYISASYVKNITSNSTTPPANANKEKAPFSRCFFQNLIQPP